METREMLAFGRFRREERLALSVAAEQAAFTLHAAESPEDAGRWLESHDAMAMLLDTEASGVARGADAQQRAARAACRSSRCRREIGRSVLQRRIQLGRGRRAAAAQYAPAAHPPAHAAA